MNDLRKLTRIILIGLAVYILVYIGFSFVMAAVLLISGVYSDIPLSAAQYLCSMALWLIFAGLVAYFLIYRVNFLSERVVGSERAKEPEAKIFWVPVAFRLVSVFSGIIYVYYIFSRMIFRISDYVARYFSSQGERVSDFNFYQFLSWIIFLAFGIYLICGAPHFVRWQVKKTLEQSKGAAESSAEEGGKN